MPPTIEKRPQDSLSGPPSNTDPTPSDSAGFAGVSAAVLSSASMSGTVPTVTGGVPNANSVIPSSVHIPALLGSNGQINTIFRYRAMFPGRVSSTGRGASFVGAVNVSVTPGNVLPNVSCEFVFDGSQLELVEWTQQKSVYRLSIDGVPLSPGPVATGLPNAVKCNRLVDFDGVRQQRLIRIEYDKLFFGGVNIGPYDTLYQPFKPLGPRAILVGDSYTHGIGADAWFTAFPNLLGGLMGWDCWPSGVGGTGYVKPGPVGTNRLTYQQRLGTDVIPYAPDIVIISGTINDTGSPPNEVANAAAEVYNTVQTQLPDTKLIVVGPWRPTPPKRSQIVNINNILMQQAQAAGAPFINGINWFTGIGYAGHRAPAGNCTYYIWTDGTHPSQAGHEFLASRLSTELLRTNHL